MGFIKKKIILLYYFLFFKLFLFIVFFFFFFVFFFFQAEDGIRDESVTGVQTCALPIRSSDLSRRRHTDESVTGVQTCALPIDRKSTRLNSSHTLISYL